MLRFLCRFYAVCQFKSGWIEPRVVGGYAPFSPYSKTRKAAVDALIYWAKTGMREFTMRDAVNEYLEASGANRPSIGGEETILAHRKIAANRLAIDCIYALSKEELSKVDRELEGIVSNLPRQGCGMRM